MKEYIELAKSEIKEAILSYSERETANEWKSAESEFKKISFKVEELIYGDENRHTDKVSHPAIRFSCDIPDNWEILENILYGFNTEKILPCILFMWLLNMNQKLWNRLHERITRKHISFKDKRIAGLLAKSQSKTGSTNNEIKIVDILFDNISEIPHDCDLAFTMIIRFLALFKLSICAKADVNFCISWFESKYGILRHFFTYDENKCHNLRDNVLKNIIYGPSEQKTEEQSLVKHYKIFNENTQNIKNKIMHLEFSNKNDIENKAENLLIDFRQLEGCFLSFRYELFKSNYAINNSLLSSADPLVQMCQLFDAYLSIEEIKIKKSKNNGLQSDFILKKVTAKFESISKIILDLDNDIFDNDNDENSKAKIIYDYDENCTDEIIQPDDCEDTSNFNKEQFNINFSELENPMPFIPISKLNMLYSPHTFIFKGVLKILSAKYNAYDTEFKLSCDEIKFDNAHLKNVQFKFKDNSEVLKCKEQKDKWYNSIFLLFANEIQV